MQGPSIGQEEREAGRVAFTLAPLHTRKDGARITAISLDPQQQRLFIGLSTGSVS